METTTIDALVLEEAQVIEVLGAARLQFELCEEPMRSGQLEPRQPHGSPERRPGTLVRAMGEFALSKGLFPPKSRWRTSSVKTWSRTGSLTTSAP